MAGTKPGHDNEESPRRSRGHDKRENALYIPCTRPRPGFWRWRRGLATELSSDGLDGRRRRLLFRSWHRGIKEMDLVMGRFADAHLHAFSDEDVEAFEVLLTVPDQQMLAWVLGAESADPQFDTPMFRRLRAFHMSNTAS